MAALRGWAETIQPTKVTLERSTKKVLGKMKPTIRNAFIGAAIATAAALFACSPQPETVAAEEDGALLSGRVVSSSGEALAGVPVRARREGANFAVAVYTGENGEYAFPAWSDVSPGTHRISIELPDFEHAAREGVSLSEGQTQQVDFTLEPRTPTVAEATASEIIAALPGTDEQKVLFAQCSNCHSLQKALETPSTKEGWMAIIRLMAGERNTSRDYPGSMTYGQKRFLEPLAEYLESIRGPGSSGEIPVKLRPRPTGPEAARLVVTEYDIPRGGQYEPFMLRGDPRFVWPHDVIVDDNYAWYTDHFSFVLGRVDKRTGEVIEIPYDVPPGGGRDMTIPAGQGRAGNPGGGSHDILFDGHGNMVIGMDDGTVRYNPAKDEFVNWASGNNMFGLDPEGNVWHTDDGGPLYEINTASGEIIEHTIPTNDGVYDMDTDQEGRTLINIWRNAKLGVFDPETETYFEYPTPTSASGPRRGEIDAEGRLWVALYYAGRVARFDPDTGEIAEFPLVSGTEAYDPPYTAPYSTSVDNENGFVWTTDFNARRLYRIDMNTGDSTEYFLPGLYEMRDLTVEAGTERPTLWIPSYRPPSQIVKVQIR